MAPPTLPKLCHFPCMSLPVKVSGQLQRWKLMQVPPFLQVNSSVSHTFSEEKRVLVSRNRVHGQVRVRVHGGCWSPVVSALRPDCVRKDVWHKKYCQIFKANPLAVATPAEGGSRSNRNQNYWSGLTLSSFYQDNLKLSLLIRSVWAV